MNEIYDFIVLYWIAIASVLFSYWAVLSFYKHIKAKSWLQLSGHAALALGLAVVLINGTGVDQALLFLQDTNTVQDMKLNFLRMVIGSKHGS